MFNLIIKRVTEHKLIRVFDLYMACYGGDPVLYEFSSAK